MGYVVNTGPGRNSDSGSPQVTPLLLAGGTGTRLWPTSRAAYPKQFSPLIGPGSTPGSHDGSPESLLQATARRLSGPGFAAPLVATREPFRFIAAHQLEERGTPAQAILLEPACRNTAPAILAAALHLAQTGPDPDPAALLLVSPTDHAIPDADAFRATLRSGCAAARDGALVLVGITPARGDATLGYLELAGSQDSAWTGPVPLASFVEKPDPLRAASMAGSGRHLWNAGLILARADTLIAAFETHAPAMLAHVRAALDEATRDADFLRLAAGPWEAIDSISMDYAILEKAGGLMALRYDGTWSDLGTWEALWRADLPSEDLRAALGPALGAAGGDGVVRHGPVTAQDCRNSLLRAEDPETRLVALGLSDMIAVSTRDAVLVAPRARAGEVGQLVETMRLEKTAQADSFHESHRPWGRFARLSKGARFQVKRIVVDPGAKLSLQSHAHRAEHWVLVEGRVRATIGDTVSEMAENQSVYVPQGTRHRLENPHGAPATLIEVQTGSYLGEDDITRYEDIYDRLEATPQHS